MKKRNFYKINTDIKADTVRLVSEDGEQLGILKTSEAIIQAKEKGLDLLLISDVATPPVCKLIDFGQYKYQQQKKKKQNKKGGKGQVVKELKMSPKISDHDYQVRVNKATEFLKKGYKVKVTLRFRGREIVHPELGKKVIARFIETISEVGVPDAPLNQVNKLMMVMLSPK
jgi:translation initiation factor IF-3